MKKTFFPNIYAQILGPNDEPNDAQNTYNIF